jgi:hypothetical protein
MNTSEQEFYTCLEDLKEKKRKERINCFTPKKGAISAQ